MKRRNQQSDISSFFKKAAISEPEPGTSHSASSSDFIAESPSTASGKAIDLEHDSDSDSHELAHANYLSAVNWIIRGQNGAHTGFPPPPSDAQGLSSLFHLVSRYC
ncbi:hypothetical protein ACJJTC_018816 [Scirpophaga incertulas]